MDWLGQVEYLASSNQQYREDASEFLAKLRGESLEVRDLSLELRAESFDKAQEPRLEVRVLKGTECAKYYPNPIRRSLGDLDIFAELKDVDSTGSPTKSLELRGGYEVVNRRCKEMGLEVEYHDYKHSKIQYKSLAIENHKFCTEIRGEKVKKDFERHLQELLKDSLKLRAESLETSSDENESCFTKTNSLSSTSTGSAQVKLSSLSSPRAQFDALFLIAHAFNHFIDEGLSLRQICDWAMFIKAEQENVDWEDFYLWMERMHMRRFADALNAIAVADLGVVITNKEIVTTSPHKDKILHEALYGHKHLHNGGLHGWGYRLAQLRIAYQDRWKYSDILQSHWLKEYFSSVWYYFMEREPKI